MDANSILDKAFVNAPLSLAIVDASGKYLYVAEAYSKRFGLESSKMVGQPLCNFVDHKQYKQHVLPSLQKCLSGRVVGYQIEQRQSSVDRLFTVRYIPCFDEKGNVWGVLNLAIDITSDCCTLNLPNNDIRYWDGDTFGMTGFTFIDYREIQSRIARSERLSTLGRSLAMLNHELRNPLGTLSASLKTLQKLLPNSSSTARIFERCNRAMLRCERVVSSILDYSKPFPVDPQLCNLDRWVEQLLHDYHVPASISVTWSPGGVGEVWIDTEMMRRALTNLMDNSVRAVLQQPAGGQRAISLQSRFTESDVELSISDSGSGFPTELQGDSKLDAKNSESIGTGFGLLIARQIIEHHRGVLTLSNTENGGAHVKIEFPKQADNYYPVEVPAKQNEQLVRH